MSDINDKKELEAFRQDRRDQQQHNRLAFQSDEAQKRREHDRTKTIEEEKLSNDALEIIHKQSLENRELDYQDAIRNGNLRLQELEAQLAIERANSEIIADNTRDRETDLIRENLKAELYKKLGDKLLNPSSANAISSEDKDAIQAQARKDLGL